MRVIQYNVSYEKMISRLPGLFAYLESNELGDMVLHHAYDSNNGCYGKIVENIELPSDVSLASKTKHTITQEDIDNGYWWYNENEEKNIAKETDKNNEIEEYQFYLKGGETYSFRTIISNYYQHKDILKDNDKFKKFVENGIGKKTVPNEYKYYYGYVNKNNDKDVIIEEEWDNKDNIEREVYIRKKLICTLVPEFVYLSDAKSLHNQMVQMRKQCKFYGDKKSVIGEDKHLCCLCDKYIQMGGVTFEEWLEECIEEAVDISNEYYTYAQEASKKMSLEFDIDLLSSYDDMGIMIPYIPTWLPYKQYYVNDKVIYNDEIYICKQNTNGKWDEEIEKIVFDTDSFEKFTNVFKVCDEEGNINEDLNTLEVKGKTNSKLTDLRRFKTYINVDNLGECPDSGYDWLYYYRVGYVCNITTLNDELGNIKPFVIEEQENEISTEDNNSVNNCDSLCQNLAAFGDVITNITNNTDEKTITFTYVLGAHLIPEEGSTYIDDDNNVYYTWKNFKRDISEKYQKYGVTYEETYNYTEKGELDKLIRGDIKITTENETEQIITFNDYITGTYDDGLKYYKFEFIKYNNSTSYNKTIANRDVNINSILTDFTLIRTDNEEFIGKTPTIRTDFFNGISYSPTLETNVRIQRGTTSVFDKHIRFGECKTIDDMIDYQNSSFFNINS